MTVTYHFTDEEKELIEELNKMGNAYRVTSENDEFRSKYKTQLIEFRHHNLIYPAPNYTIRCMGYKVSKKGLKAFKSIIND